MQLWVGVYLSALTEMGFQSRLMCCTLCTTLDESGIERETDLSNCERGGRGDLRRPL